MKQYKNTRIKILKQILRLIFYLPYNLTNYILSKIFKSENSHDNLYFFRIVDQFYKNNTPYFRFQIKGTRATFDMDLFSIITSRYALKNIDPFNLFEIGYSCRSNESTQLRNEPSNVVNFRVGIRKTIDNFLSYLNYHHKKYALRIINYNLLNDDVILMLVVLDTELKFEIPYKELTKDFSLLSTIEPTDIVRIGYSIREEEIKRNIKLAIKQ